MLQISSSIRFDRVIRIIEKIYHFCEIRISPFQPWKHKGKCINNHTERGMKTLQNHNEPWRIDKGLLLSSMAHELLIWSGEENEKGTSEKEI